MIGFWKYDTEPFLHGEVTVAETQENGEVLGTVPVYGRGTRFYLRYLMSDTTGEKASSEYDELVKERDRVIQKIRDDFSKSMVKWNARYEEFGVGV